MTSNQESSTIFWGLGSIKGIGESTAIQIINERDKNGEFRSFADFYFRSTFKGSKVKKQTYEALITAGAFDVLYKLEGEEHRRHFLIKRYRKFKKVKVSNPLRDIYTIGNVTESWWWGLQQKRLTGLANIDYKKIAEENDILAQFCTPLEAGKKQSKAVYRAFGGYIVESRVSRSKKGEFARLTIEHNYKLFKVILWNEEYKQFKDQLKGSEKSLIIFEAELKYDGKWAKANQFVLKKTSNLIVLS